MSPQLQGPGDNDDIISVGSAAAAASREQTHLSALELLLYLYTTKSFPATAAVLTLCQDLSIKSTSTDT